jgi:epsilon-lactone hydrolase
MQKTSMEKLLSIKAILKKSASQSKSVNQIRSEGEITAAGIPRLPGIKTEAVNVDGLNAEWVIAEKVPALSENTILYFHGGSFVSGSCRTHLDLASRISIASGVRVLLIEYRLAPENKYPAAADDCMAAYRWLLKNGTPAENIIIGGDSTGGYLVLMTLLSLRGSPSPLPKAAFLLSPHTDFLYFDGESYLSRQEADPINTPDGIKKCGQDYFGESIPSPSVLSPLNEDLTGLPPLFIQVGEDEVILSDSTRLAERAEAAGVNAVLEVWENMWHIFRFMAYMLPEGQEAINHIGEFIKGQFHR